MNAIYIKVIAIALMVVFLLSLLILTTTYIFRVDSPALVFGRKALHLPAIIVDGDFITIAEIDRNTESIKQFYESQDFSKFGVRIDFNTDDGKKRLQLQERKMINKLIEDIAIERIAEEWRINLSDAAVQSAMDRPMDEMGTRENVEEKLQNLYGWTLEDFGEKVVRGQLLRERVATRFIEENEATEEMRQKIAQAKKELDDGRVFNDTVQQYSEGSTADEGGVMGWFNEMQLQDEIGKQVIAMEAGTYSDVIETPLGLHLVYVNEVSEESEQKLWHISQIIVKKKTFSEYLNEQISQMQIKMFMPDYAWNSESGLVEFVSTDMVDFEEQMKQEAIDVQEKLINE